LKEYPNFEEKNLMKKIQYCLIIATLLFSFFCEKKPTDNDDILSIEDLLIKNNEITGWTYGGSSWVANNVSELTTYINGAAEIYQRHGFVEAAHQQYQGKIDNVDRQLRIFVYNQGNENNSKTLYEDPDLGLSGAIEWTNGAGDTAHYIRYGGLAQTLSFYKDRYFVSLEINYDTEESLNILKQFALNIDGNIN